MRSRGTSVVAHGEVNAPSRASFRPPRLPSSLSQIPDDSKPHQKYPSTTINFVYSEAVERAFRHCYRASAFGPATSKPRNPSIEIDKLPQLYDEYRFVRQLQTDTNERLRVWKAQHPSRQPTFMSEVPDKPLKKKTQSLWMKMKSKSNGAKNGQRSTRGSISSESSRGEGTGSDNKLDFMSLVEKLREKQQMTKRQPSLENVMPLPLNRQPPKLPPIEQSATIPSVGSSKTSVESEEDKIKPQSRERKKKNKKANKAGAKSDDVESIPSISE